MQTIVNHHNFNWLYRAHDPYRYEFSDLLDCFFYLLRNYPLDARFENYGCFAINLGEGWVRFWGNFAEISACFSIDSNDGNFCEQTRKLIKENMRSEKYKELKKTFVS